MRIIPEAQMGEGDSAARRELRGRLVEYDAERRRVWVCGQRLHHGLTGALVAVGGLAGLVGRRLTARGGLEWTLLGSLLMAHDWSDRGHWFEPGRQAD